MSEHKLIVPPKGAWFCTMDGKYGGTCGKPAVVGCDGNGERCLIGGDAWCKKHDPRARRDTRGKR